MSKKRYKYKTVVTDHTWGDLKIERKALEQVGSTVADPQCEMDDQQAIIEATKDADAVLTQNALMTRNVVESLDKCRVIICYGVGLEVIDIQAATERGIMVANVPDYCKDEVADHTMALMLSCLRKVTQETIAIKKNPKGLTYGGPLFGPMFKLREQVLGLIGFGTVARNLVAKARPFGFEIIAHDRFVDKVIFREHNVVPVSLDKLLRTSDVVSLHLPLNENTKNLIAESQLKKMKENAYLINTSRGQVVDEAALYKALKMGWVAGAALDVTVHEPVNPDNPLLKLDNLIITNHTGYYSEGCLEDVRTKAAEEARRVLGGKSPRPIAFVNPEVKTRAIR